MNRLVETLEPTISVIVPGSTTVTSLTPLTAYKYDALGRKIAEITPNANSKVPVSSSIDYVYDKAGRLVQSIVHTAEGNLVTQNYYDKAGRLVKVIDPELQEVKSEYNCQGLVLAENDAENRITYHQYNPFGQEIAVTDYRGLSTTQGAPGWTPVKVAGIQYYLNPDYTVSKEYDSLSRLVKTVDLLGTTVKIKYNNVGSKLEEKVIALTGETRATSYTYTPQYWVETVINPDGYKVEYRYDKAGHKIAEIYPDIPELSTVNNNIYRYAYDGLGRLEKLTKPDGGVEIYGYDEVGNRTTLTNARGYTTTYDYNALNNLIKVTEPNSAVTQYYYDPNGNLVRRVQADNLQTDYTFNELNLLTQELGVRAGDWVKYRFAYDKAGRVKAKQDPRGVVTVLAYYKDGQPKEQASYVSATPNMSLDLKLVQVGTAPTGYTLEERVTFQYYPAGNLYKVTDNLGSETYEYDKLNRIKAETRELDGKTYRTEYDYDFVGELSKIKYPLSDEWVNYYRDNTGHLVGISQVADNWKADPLSNPQNFTYDTAGNLHQLRYNNGVVTDITPGQMGRPDLLTVRMPDGSTALSLDYAYDKNGNVLSRNNNIYQYDALDRLMSAEIDGTFLVNTPAESGYVAEDYLANSPVHYELGDVQVALDYAASTLGVKFGAVRQIGRVELEPQLSTHRVSRDNLRIFAKSDGTGNFAEVAAENWEFKKEETSGKIVITFKNAVSACEIKIHTTFDDRDMLTGLAKNVAQFTNQLKSMVKVYARTSRVQIDYQYDLRGNRKSETFTDVGSNYSVTYTYGYYFGSDRLKTRESQSVSGMKSVGGYVDGILSYGASERKAYRYDIAGNLLEKGNNYTINGNSVMFTVTSGKDVEYWRYQYNAINKLSTVWKNGTGSANIVARYFYDYAGDRLKVVEGSAVTHYVYGYSGKMLFEARYKTVATDPSAARGSELTESKVARYIYAFGQQLAKVEKTTENGQTRSVVYYYHNDNLGSTKMMTKQAGAGENLVVFRQDYTPFGQNLQLPGESSVSNQIEATLNFTGQIEETDIGLSYYNARYYDPEIGRFTQEDTHSGHLENPLTQNPYIYTLDNPLKYTDPTGHEVDNNSDWSVKIPATDGDFGITTTLYMNSLGQYCFSRTEIYDDGSKTVTNFYLDKNGKAEYKIIKTFNKNGVMIGKLYREDLYYDTNGFILKCLEFGLDIAPGVNDVKGFYEGVTGKTAFTKEKLKWWERGLGLIGLTEVKDVVKGGKKVVEVADGVADLAKGAGKTISDDTLKWLSKGDADTSVYFGIKNGEPVYTGITKQQLAKRLYQHNYNGKGFDTLVEQVNGLTKNQARAVEQYLIENGSANVFNKINSISPDSKYYLEALLWAENFVKNLK